MANLVSFVLLLALLGTLYRRAGATAFEVGGDDGWVVPHSKEGGMYNQWASKNRFLVGDSVHFKYKKDSVMVVTEDDYNNCRASHPIFFSNNGDTQVQLDRAGLFYFISGVTGHCERGQRMIIKVIGRDAPPPAPQAASPPPTPPSPPNPSGAAPGTSVLAGTIAVAAMALPFVVHGV
ncbi:early nodulin-like protein 6 [Phragmites australis]|uniref:early nodulin-like protein 6 n=1 Tax=Phragmites australis TaxID=29695 RepID=UPI002D76C3B3|nr:early nodulin-like protein 6 [Phragmites australis]